MIFISNGTEQYPFTRLVKAIDKAKEDGLIRDEVIIQDNAVSLGYKIKNCLHYPVLPYEKLVELIKNCDIYICHAGVGAIINGLNNNKIPIVVPRYKKYGEHINNHQLEISREFRKRKIIVACYDDDDIIEKINNYKIYTKDLSNIYKNTTKDEFLSYVKIIVDL